MTHLQEDAVFRSTLFRAYCTDRYMHDCTQNLKGSSRSAKLKSAQDARRTCITQHAQSHRTCIQVCRVFLTAFVRMC